MHYYIASGLENAAQVRELRDALNALGHVQTYDWTVHGAVRDQGPGVMACVAFAEINGVMTADVVIVLLPGGRGTHFEFGAATEAAIPVYLHSPDPDAHFGTGAETCAFYHLDNVRRIGSLSMRDLAARVDADDADDARDSGDSPDAW